MREIRFSRVMSQRPDLFINCPISSVLKPRSAGPAEETALTLKEWSIASLQDKAAIISGISRLFEESKLNASLRDDVLLTVDEFVCNALFNARQSNGVNLEDLETTMEQARRE